MVSVNVKHHVYLLDHCQNNYVQTSRTAQVLTADSMVPQPSCRASPPGTQILVPGCAVKRLNQLVTSSRNVHVLDIMCQLSHHVGRSYQVESVPLLRAGRSKSHVHVLTMKGVVPYSAVFRKASCGWGGCGCLLFPPFIIFSCFFILFHCLFVCLFVLFVFSGTDNRCSLCFQALSCTQSQALNYRHTHTHARTHARTHAHRVSCIKLQF